MLVVISDIHFADGTAGEYNNPYAAFKSILLFDMAVLAKGLKILMLGDIVDIIRGTKWFGVGLPDMPW